MLIMPETCLLVLQGPDNELYFSNFKNINVSMKTCAFDEVNFSVDGEVTVPRKFKQQLLSFDVTEDDILGMFRGGSNEQNLYSS